jgi:hypothetical protein
MRILTGVFAACFAVAVISMTTGNPTAINGVIGAGFGTLFMGACAFLDRGRA